MRTRAHLDASPPCCSSPLLLLQCSGRHKQEGHRHPLAAWIDRDMRAPGREPALLLLVPAAAAAAVVARQPVLARPPHERVPPEPARCRVLPPAEQRLLRSGPDTDTPSLTDGAGVQGFFRVPADL